VGGTNVHVILEDTVQTQSTEDEKPQILLFSAKSEESLNQYYNQFSNFLEKKRDFSLADAAYTLAMKRKHFFYRKFCLSNVSDSNIISEQNFCGNGVYNGKKYEVIFMFPGQGSQYAGMYAELYQNDKFFSFQFDECISIYTRINPSVDLKSIIFNTEDNETLRKTEYAQPALFIGEYCIAQTLMHYGIMPDALIGHSVGEFVAACLAGVFSLEDAIKMISARASMMQKMPQGVMLSVRMNSKDAINYVNDNISLAAVNTDDLFVLSGKNEDIEHLQKQLDKLDIKNSVLQTSHAFHSYMMDDVLPEFEKVVEKIKLNIPRIPVMSTVTAAWLPDYLAVDKKYWVNHLRVTVRFGDSVKALNTDKNKLFIETGPKNILSILARQQISDFNVPVFVSAPDKHEYLNFLKLFGHLWLHGLESNWSVLLNEDQRQIISLPPYAFEKKPYWLDAISAKMALELSENTILPENSTIQADDVKHYEKSIEEIIREILEDSSGISLKGINSNATFIDIGLDSLFLTQVALSIQKKTSVKVTFRQLNEELNSIAALSDYIEQNISVEIQSKLTIETDKPEFNNLSDIIQKLKLSDGDDYKNIAEKVAEFIENQKTNKTNYQAESKPFGAIARIETKKEEILNPEIENFLKNFIEKYNKRTLNSKLYTQKYRNQLADPRVVTGFKPYNKEITYQIVVKKSKGCYLWDLDGNKYIDILNGFGSNFFGYANKTINREIKKVLKSGYEIGPQHYLTGEVVKLICELTGQERAALCNTGSEAVLGLIRIARTITGKSKIVMFNGSYHGINDEVIVRGGANLKSYPAAPGVPHEAVQNALVLDYGDANALEIIEKNADEIAAVLVEPVQSRRPEFRPYEFLKELRNVTAKNEIVYIFDEVITGFRMHQAGIQGIIGIQADLTSYGKVPGGGLPIGIMAGKSQFMDTLDGGFWQYGDLSKPESGVTYFAGTFVRHPLALASSLAALNYLKNEGNSLQDKLNRMCEAMVDEMNFIAEKHDAPVVVKGFGSLFRITFTRDIPFTELLFPLMRYNGIHVLENFPCFLTLAHSSQDVKEIITVFEKCLIELKSAKVFEAKSIDRNILGLPPVEGARLGKDPEGNPGWYIPDPERPGKYLKIT